MSGIEIVLIVGAGILIAKKLDDRKKRKQGLEPTASTREFLSNRRGKKHAPPQMVVNPPPTTTTAPQAQTEFRVQPTNRQQVPVEEEALPLYSPSSRDQSTEYYSQGAAAEKTYLPTYDEARGHEAQAQAQVHQPAAANPFADANEATPKQQKHSRVSRLWKREGAKPS